MRSPLGWARQAEAVVGVGAIGQRRESGLKEFDQPAAEDIVADIAEDAKARAQRLQGQRAVAGRPADPQLALGKDRLGAGPGPGATGPRMKSTLTLPMTKMAGVIRCPASFDSRHLGGAHGFAQTLDTLARDTDQQLLQRRQDADRGGQTRRARQRSGSAIPRAVASPLTSMTMGARAGLQADLDLGHRGRGHRRRPGGK